MMQLTRRKLFAGAAAAGAATALTPLAARSPAFAAVPPAGKQVPGVYRQKLGSFELTQITDGAARRPVSNGYVANISKDEAVAETEKLHYQKDQVVIPFNPLVINTGSK
ncbi:MAG: MBL fold metallo-hydrolase, partial [Rhizobiales bacterium]|nr:MBL fold metallo-hydrolase [Hyphomicrobiales bacterium]